MSRLRVGQASLWHANVSTSRRSKVRLLFKEATAFVFVTHGRVEKYVVMHAPTGESERDDAQFSTPPGPGWSRRHRRAAS